MQIFSRKITVHKTDFFSGSTDYHCHILPNVDDGVRSIAEALEVLSYFDTLGMQKVVLTPHVMEDLRDNTSAIDARFEILKTQYEGNIQLSLAAEYMIDGEFDNYLATGLKPLFDNHVLVETSYFAPPTNLDERLYSLSSNGYVPVIAHPERYAYMGQSRYENLIFRNCVFQLNILSLAGCYGKNVKLKAEYLLDHGMYGLMGSDLHNLSHFKHWIESLKVTRSRFEALSLLKRQ